MNWLAHVFLSQPDVEFRLGNLLADLVKGRERAAMPARFLEGVQQHRAIDAFTDSHPVFHRSRARVEGEFRLTSGILVDVFYDHFLALDWDTYAAEPLEEFTGRLYADIRQCPIELPPVASFVVERMLEDDRLGSYRSLDGIAETLWRISQRLESRTGRDFRLKRGVDELVAHFDELRGDFCEFFPQLVVHVENHKTFTSCAVD